MPISRLPKQGALIKSLLAVGVLSAIAACGGGTDYKAPPTPQNLTIKGTAATGKAISGGLVAVTCKTGTGTATTNADGTYTVLTTDPSVGPCVVAVTFAGATLRSVAAGNGSVANVTPLTEMLVVYVAKQSGLPDGAAPSALVGSATFDTIVNSPTTLNASAAQVVAVIKSLGVTVPADFLSASLVATSGSTQGNGQDQALDALAKASLLAPNGTPGLAVAQAVVADAGKHIFTGATGGG